MKFNKTDPNHNGNNVFVNCITTLYYSTNEIFVCEIGIFVSIGRAPMKPLSMTNKITSIVLTVVSTQPVSSLLIHQIWNVDVF